MALSYLHGDHLGSNSLMTDAAGTIVPNSQADWRNEPNTASLTDLGYTGHRHNNTATNDLDLIYMNARYYVPSLGRFASADTLVPDPLNSQTHNRYSYAYNNPTKYSDPTGHIGCIELGAEECILDENGNPTDDFVDAPPLLEPENVITVGMFPLINFYVVLLPPGTPVNQNQGNVVIPEGWDPEVVSQALAITGAGLDLLEMLTVWNPALSTALGFADWGVTLTSCYYAGECYVDQPHPDLPIMAVANQDVLLNGIDAVVPLTMGDNSIVQQMAVDFVTSFISLGYDVFDAGGVVPNYVSLGVALNPDIESADFGLHIYILIYSE